MLRLDKSQEERKEDVGAFGVGVLDSDPPKKLGLKRDVASLPQHPQSEGKGEESPLAWK